MAPCVAAVARRPCGWYNALARLPHAAPRTCRFSTFLVLENVGRQPVSHLTLQFEETQPQRRAPATLEEEFFSGRPNTRAREGPSIRRFVLMARSATARRGIAVAAQTDVFWWNADVLRSILPIAPGTTVQLPVVVTGKGSRYAPSDRMQPCKTAGMPANFCVLGVLLLATLHDRSATAAASTFATAV